ncbi:hypothetical protein [Streptomyces ureilyticus]|uniref:Secreted protein n=1 Tax=Streptomyces ureilyticus TaxID=1775131 RepID=A0ABX0DFJ2_9ACTN|nr:hypothetical protein [Streptomyces ureilyticus]NGO40632.1 hypothetical protein [Streptomyces ureilyticus]
MTQSRLLRSSVAGLVGLAALGSGLVMAGPAQAEAPARAAACKTIKITGGKVAVRMPDRGDTVADSNDRVTRYVYRGDKLRSCVIAIGRGQTYTKCGRTGYDWYIVRGGQVPLTCAKRV